ncbi:VOC family protein [Pseudonocardia pini]|uniref:VOC family protein n=1 Tax=Pseudonocardia pini TaxID=2758030 RepID=UPI001FED19D8|nr:VOC family protein [Pseudonocardia pini]
MATQNIYAADLDAAREWYTRLFGGPPYFVVEGGYLEWRLGPRQDEFGIVAASWAPHPVGTPAGQILFWAVEDVAAALKDLVELGATEHQPVTVRGPGFVTASVVDPFGNVLGIMENSHVEEGLRGYGGRP